MATIRQIREDEYLKVGGLWWDFMMINAAFDDSFTVKRRARELFASEMAQRASDPDSLLSVAELDGELVGFCFSYVSRKPRYFRLGKFGFIGDLFVRPEYRRQGIGHDLVRAAMKFFEKNKVKQVELLVAIKNEDTIKFWESIGFSKLLAWMYRRI